MTVTPGSRALIASVLAAILVACRTSASVAPAEGTPPPAGPASAPTEAPIEVAPPVSGPLPPQDWDPKSAAAYLDKRMHAWMDHPPQVGNNVACAMTCHTAMPFAAAQLELPSAGDAGRALRLRIEERVSAVESWSDATPFYGHRATARGRQSQGSEAVLNAASSAFLDRAEGKAPGPSTLRALSHMWQAQRPDGGFDWLDFDLEPWENGTEVFGAAIAARAVATLGAADRERFARPTAKLIGFLRARSFNARVPIFTRASVLWAAADLDGLLDDGERVRHALSFAGQQNDDGGFSWRQTGIAFAEAASWHGLTLVEDADVRSDPLPTAVVLLAMCSSVEAATGAGTSALDAAKLGVAAARARSWLVKRQTTEGYFPSQSPNRNRALSHAVMTDAATAYAALALARCPVAAP